MISVFRSNFFTFVTPNTLLYFYSTKAYIKPGITDDIEWTKIPGEMPEDRIQITYKYNLDTNESKLKINDLGFSDEGTYYCYAYNRDGVRKGVSMTLRIIGELHS